MKVPPMPLPYAALVLLLLTAGCARVTPETAVSQPPAAATPPATPQPAAKPDAPAKPQAAAPQPAAKPATPAKPQTARAAVPPAGVAAGAPRAAVKVAPPVAKTPAPVARAPKPAASPVAAPPAAAATLDLDALKARLRATKAIGVFTKISLKNQVDDLMEQFSEHYEGKATPTMKELRQSYNLLMMKVLTLLQDDDQPLASAIVSSREAIWSLLANPTTFAALQV